MAIPSSIARWVIMFNVFFVVIGSPDILLENAIPDQTIRYQYLTRDCAHIMPIIVMALMDSCVVPLFRSVILHGGNLHMGSVDS